MGFIARQYEKYYRGVFFSTLDYDLNMSKVRLARMRESCGEQPTEEQRGAVLRLDRLKELGGIDESYLPARMSTTEELESILKEMNE